MKKLLRIISTITAAVIGSLIGSILGNSLLEAYRGTNEMVTAKDAFDLTKVTPLVFAVVAAWLNWKLWDD